MWAPEIPPEPPEPAPAPVRRRRVPQWRIDRTNEKRALEKWELLRPPSYEWERYTSETRGEWWAMIMHAPDTPHPLVYCMENPREWGTGLAYCEACRSSECSGCAWAWAAFKFGKAVDVPAIEDGLPF